MQPFVETRNTSVSKMKSVMQPFVETGNTSNFEEKLSNIFIIICKNLYNVLERGEICYAMVY